MVISPGNDSTIPNWVKDEEGTTLFHHISSASTLYMIWSFSKCSQQRINKFKLSNPPHSDNQHEQQAPEVENKLTLWLASTYFPLQPRKSWVFQLSAPVRLKMQLYWTLETLVTLKSSSIMLVKVWMFFPVKSLFICQRNELLDVLYNNLFSEALVQ